MSEPESTLPFMPFWVDRFFGGTLKMDGEEQSLYMLLLAHQWATGPLPKDPKRLAKLIRYDEKRFLKLWPAIAHKFTEIDAGLVNLTLEDIRSESERKARTNKQRSKVAAEARWNKAKSNAPSILRLVPNDCSSDAPSIARDHARLMPSHIPEEESKSGCAASPVDPRKQLFDLGKTILGANAGGLISKAISRTDEKTVAAVLGQMALRSTADPRSYFVAATTPKTAESRGFVV